jgi:Rrf2 family protein
VGLVKLSVKSDYAARAVLGLARHYATSGAVRVEALAAEQGVPANYLVQILIELKGQGIARSVRGKEGGYLLARPPAEITLGDVLRAVHGALFDTPALADNSDCPAELRRAWQQLKQAVESAADAINFQQLLDESSEKAKMYYI